MNAEIKVIAERLRDLRLIDNYSIETMAAACEVTPAEYQKFESGESDFNFTFLFRCAQKLGVDISELVSGESPTLSYFNIVRAGEGMQIKKEHDFDYEHLAFMLKNRLAEPFIVTAQYSSEADSAPIHTSTHEGQELDYILEGNLKVQYEDHVEILGPGDSIMYESSYHHGMVATDGKDCKFLAVVIKGELKKPVGKEKSGDKVSDSDLIYKNYARETLDENGLLKGIEFEYPDNFNFAYDIIDELAKKSPNKLAMQWLSKDGEEKKFTFAGMSKYSNMTANFLTSLGIKKGDRVMVVLKRHYQFWYTILALHKIGAVAIPATHQLMPHDFEYRFKAAGISALICTSADTAAASADEACKNCPDMKTKIIVGGSREGWHDFDKGIANEDTNFTRIETSVTDPTIMFFTSGTTGYPKIAAHDYTYPLGHIVTAKWWHNVDPNGLHFTISDTGWAKSMWGKLYGQWLCEAAIFTFDFDRFDAKEILPLFAKYKITTFCAPPTMFRFFIKDNLAAYDLSSLKYATIAGEALNPEVYNQFLAATGIKLMEGFGQTETTVAVANLVGTDTKPGSMGKPNPQYNIDLIDGEGKTAKDGEVGEIIIRTGEKKPVGMFYGYYLNEEATNSVWHDGIYHTGDMAWRDEDGYFWYVGRTDDLIKSSGYRIGPFEIESVIMELPYVLECAITGVPDEVRGQAVKATIVLTKDAIESDELKKEIQDYVKHHTAPYKYPRIVEFVKELPKTISGKIRRVEIRGK